ncbi:hypothetical protein NVP1100O_47 [Vibrio phage 1.100.O._10N.261.45.C3]|nr:hypothetical protein NVP1100O_47 [Vibrio phage 1.100.O._10N.261.45.C3]
MKEAKFTKGPWVLIDGQFSSEVEITTENRQENSKGKICEMDIYFDGQHGIEQPANAHLIAAAPEMYEMLAEVLHNMEVGNSDHTEINDAMIPRVSALLAKARGES